MTRQMKIMATVLGVVFGGIIAFNLFKAFMIKRFFASYEKPPAAVSSVKVIEKDWAPRLSSFGNFVALNGVEVNSQLPGNVVKILFNSGDYIEKDEPLIEIDDSVDQATLAFNQAQLTLKNLSYKRQTDLFQRGATPKSNVDEAAANLQQAQADVDKSMAQIKQKHISAPFSGRLGIRQVNLGQYIKAGDTPIVTLQSIDPLYLQFYVPEQNLKRIHVNQPIHFKIDEYPNLEFKGQINAINSKVDIKTHNVLVQATLANCPNEQLLSLKSDQEKNELLTIEKVNKQFIVTCDTEKNKAHHVTNFAFIPGMFASIDIQQPALHHVIVVPSTAISYSLYGNSVFVINPDPSGKKDKDGKPVLKVERVYVTVGDQVDPETVIKEGLKEGQTIVSIGEIKLQPGSKVVINNSVKPKLLNNSDQLGQ
jgi:membrane fusion protein (multidrug efflux system)